MPATAARRQKMVAAVAAIGALAIVVTLTTGIAGLAGYPWQVRAFVALVTLVCAASLILWQLRPAHDLSARSTPLDKTTYAVTVVAVLLFAVLCTSALSRWPISLTGPEEASGGSPTPMSEGASGGFSTPMSGDRVTSGVSPKSLAGGVG